MARKTVAAEEQEPLFSLTPDRENQLGSIRTWKDDLLEEQLGELHESRDEFDRRDAQAWETAGKIGLETSGTSRRQADRILNARAARQIIEAGIEERARQREIEEEERRKKREEELLELLRPVGDL